MAANGRRQSWKVDRAASMAGWLTAQLDMARGTGAQLVPVAENPENLRTVAGAFEDVLLSWDKTRSIARFSTPETEADPAAEAQGLSAAQIHTLARRMRTRATKREGPAGCGRGGMRIAFGNTFTDGFRVRKAPL
jgi:hypothetical protein